MRALRATEDSGPLLVLPADNLEIFVKVLHGCSRSHYWVFAAA